MTRFHKSYGWVLVMGILVTLAGWQLGAGLYIHAKAQLGQLLIAQAWETSLTAGSPTKPWSWADTYPVGRLIIKDLGVDQYVLAGTSGRTLAFGPGHHDGTVLPGDIGRSLIAGHRDTHFSFLKDVRPGQLIEFQRSTGHWHTFQIEETFIMNIKQERFVLDSEAPSLALTTCYPFHSITASGPLRYVVLAKIQES